MKRLEKAIIATALFSLLLIGLTSSGILPRRSFASMSVGFLSLSAMAVEPVLLSWFVVRQIMNRGERPRHWWVVVLVGIAGSVPAFALGAFALGRVR